jgi:hypothetical protein
MAAHSSAFFITKSCYAPQNRENSRCVEVLIKQAQNAHLSRIELRFLACFCFASVASGYIFNTLPDE